MVAHFQGVAGAVRVGFGTRGMSPLSARSDCTDSDSRIKQTKCQASPPVSFSSSGCTYSSGFAVWIPPHSLSLSFLAPVKNEVVQPLRSAGTEVGILLGSFVSSDIPYAAINTEGILFDSGQSVSAGGASLRFRGEVQGVSRVRFLLSIFFSMGESMPGERIIRRVDDRGRRVRWAWRRWRDIACGMWCRRY